MKEGGKEDNSTAWEHKEKEGRLPPLHSTRARLVSYTAKVQQHKLRHHQDFWMRNERGRTSVEKVKRNEKQTRRSQCPIYFFSQQIFTESS